MSKKTPWETHTLDLPGTPGAWDGKYGRLKGFWLLFLLLRISPSYELARKSTLGPLSSGDSNRLPADFGEVVSTYEKLGDVLHVSFGDWWRQRAARYYGQEMTVPVRQVAFIDSSERRPESAYAGLEWHFEHERVEDGCPDSVLLSVPIGGRPDLVLKHVHEVLKGLAPVASPLVPALALTARLTDARVRVLEQGVKLMLAQAAFPKAPMWQIGALATPHRADEGALSSLDKLTRDRARMNLSTSTNRDLKKFERIAENAARGKFPDDGRVVNVRFDYEEVGARLARTYKWQPPSFAGRGESFKRLLAAAVHR